MGKEVNLTAAEEKQIKIEKMRRIRDIREQEIDDYNKGKNDDDRLDIDVKDINCNYKVELGRKYNNQYIGIYESNEVKIPRNKQLESAEFEEMKDFVIAFSDDGKGVQSEEMMEHAMKEAKKLVNDEIRNEVKAEVRSEVKAEVIEKQRNNIMNLMKNAHFTLEQALDVLMIPEEERKLYNFG